MSGKTHNQCQLSSELEKLDQCDKVYIILLMMWIYRYICDILFHKKDRDKWTVLNIKYIFAEFMKIIF